MTIKIHFACVDLLRLFDLATARQTETEREREEGGTTEVQLDGLLVYLLDSIFILFIGNAY